MPASTARLAFLESNLGLSPAMLTGSSGGPITPILPLGTSAEGLQVTKNQGIQNQAFQTALKDFGPGKEGLDGALALVTGSLEWVASKG